MSCKDTEIVQVLKSAGNRYARIISIDPGYTNMGTASILYDKLMRKASITSIDIWSIGNKKTPDHTLIDNLTNLLSQKVQGRYDCCIIEKQGGIAQRKVIRVEQHISTMLHHAYKIPVYVYSPKLRGRMVSDDMKNLSTQEWLTTLCRNILKGTSTLEVQNEYENMTSKQKTDIGAAVTQVGYILTHNNLISC